MKAQVINAFDKVDVNKNGKISNDEMINLLKDLGIEPLYINTLAALVMTFVGGDKEIPRKEFEATFKDINEQGGWTMVDLFFQGRYRFCNLIVIVFF